MPSSVCGDPMMCQNCKKSVPNAIFHVYHRRGFHYPAQKCEENFILFLIKGEMLVNSREYAGTMLKAGEFPHPYPLFPNFNIFLSLHVLI